MGAPTLRTEMGTPTHRARIERYPDPPVYFAAMGVPVVSSLSCRVATRRGGVGLLSWLLTLPLRARW